MLSETLTPELLAGAVGLAAIVLVTNTFFTLQQRKLATVRRLVK